MNRLDLRRLLPQVVLDAFTQIMQQKLCLFPEQKHTGSASRLNQSTSQMAIKNLNQNAYCGGIVYHYLHPNQLTATTQEKIAVKIISKSKRNEKY